MTDIRKKLKELVDGCEGVTPGTWDSYVPAGGDRWSVWSIPRCGDLCVADCGDKNNVHSGHNAAHIARCDPDTIREIYQYVLHLEDENERLRDGKV